MVGGAGSFDGRGSVDIEDAGTPGRAALRRAASSMPDMPEASVGRRLIEQSRVRWLTREDLAQGRAAVGAEITG